MKATSRPTSVRNVAKAAPRRHRPVANATSQRHISTVSPRHPVRRQSTPLCRSTPTSTPMKSKFSSILNKKPSAFFSTTTTDASLQQQQEHQQQQQKQHIDAPSEPPSHILNMARLQIPRLIPEVELNMTSDQIRAMEVLISESLPRLSPDQLNQRSIQHLRKRADTLIRDYAENPDLIIALHRLASESGAGTQTNAVLVNQQSQRMNVGEGLSSLHKLSSKHNGDTPEGFVIDPENAESIEKRLKGKKLVETPGEIRAKARETKKAKTPTEIGRMISQYYHLTKPRIAQMVAFTSLWGYFSVGTPVNWQSIAVLTIGTMALSASASIINQIREIDVDKLMPRTMSRPLVTGAISIDRAKQLVAAYAILGSTLLTTLSPIAAALGVANIYLYGGLYTSMKRTTALNTEAGALVGAIPPIMGYMAAVSDNPVPLNLTAMLYPAAMMITWQMQHVMLIVARRAKEYNNSGLVMQCKDDPELKTTIRKGIAYSLLSTALTVVPIMTGHCDLVQYGATYAWAVYTAFYTQAMLKQDHARLHTILLAGYALLGATALLALKSQVPIDSFGHLILDGPDHPSPAPPADASFWGRYFNNNQVKQ